MKIGLIETLFCHSWIGTVENGKEMLTLLKTLIIRVVWYYTTDIKVLFNH